MTLETPVVVEADDYCDACGEQVANRECDHGQLCDDCYEAVHGSAKAKCEGI